MKITFKYYEIIGDFQGEPDVLFGSYVKKDCEHELESEKESWKDQGYKKIKIVSRDTSEEPDHGIYSKNEIAEIYKVENK